MKRLFIAVMMILSVTTAFAQIVNNAEYFFDTDPGPGNGTPISINAPGVSVSFPVQIPINLSPGFHWLGIRVKDSDGRWSLFQRKDLYVSQPGTDLPIITKAEYFFDNDPGAGNGTPLNFQNTGFSVSQTFPITVPVSMTAGTHLLAIRVKDQAGHWSLFQRDTIVVGAASTISCPGNVVVSATEAQCSAIVNNIDPIISQQATAYTYSLTGATTGSGSGTASGTAFNAGVTTVKYALTDAPSTSCSFTVTVNSGTTASVTINASSTNICAGQSVTFTATPTNGGGTPAYQWKLNGNNIVGATSSTYQTSSLTNGDVISVAMTSSISCASPTTATSNLITMTVNPNLPQTVSIEASATTICFGQTVTFTATPVNAGSNIVYEWMVNNNAVGSNSPVYQSSSLANGDKIQVSMVSTQTCGGRNQVFSNLITMNVNSALTPSVTIGASAIDICAGTNVTFMATPINGGSTPSYQWKLNGNNVGTNSATYQNSSLNNADTIRVVMTTSLSCANSPSATSNYISMDVTQPVSPSVIITASSTSICSGQSVSFTATPTNGGASPVYQWKINGVVAGTNSSTFQASSLSNSDVVSVSMTSSLPCVTAPIVNSNSISIAVLQQITYYADLDGDGYGNSSSGMMQSCSPQTGYVANNSDCNDNNASVHPGATDICGNSIDDDCDGQTDEGCESPDNDNDGYTVEQGDCNDNNASVNPGATEVCGNSIDDNCNGQTDENCTDSLPTLITKTYPVKEGDAGYTIVNVEVKLDKPAMLPISVDYATNNANATAGSDYIATHGTLSIPVGAISGTIQIKVIGDLLREDNESFWLGFSNPVNVVLGSDPRTRIMIIDDDKGKPNSATPTKEMVTEAASFKIPTVVKRNTVWMIPQISYYENEVLVMNVQGQIVSRFINYKNQTSIGNVAAGVYFYKIRIRESDGQHKFYSGRLLITE